MAKNIYKSGGQWDWEVEAKGILAKTYIQIRTAVEVDSIYKWGSRLGWTVVNWSKIYTNWEEGWDGDIYKWEG